MSSFPRAITLAISLVVTSSLTSPAADFFSANHGTYFGTFKNGEGFWAMLVPAASLDRLRFICYLPNHRVAYISPSSPYAEIDWNDAGDFFFEGHPNFPGNVYGTITDGQMTGWYQESTYTEPYTGEIDSGGGDFVQPAGTYFILTDTGGSGMEVHGILGPGGKFVAVVLGYGSVASTQGTTRSLLWVSGTSGVVDARGHAEFVAPEGVRGSLSIDANGVMRTTVYRPSDNAVLSFSGQIPLNRLGDRLVNISTRAWVDEGDNQLISGFAIAGPGTKRVLLRAIGPGLAAEPFGFAHPLADPRITLTRDGVAVAGADNWGESGNGAELTSAIATTGAFPVAAGSKDAMLLADLPAGLYSAVISDPTGTNGVGLAEVYAVDDSEPSEAWLVNISTRAFVGTDEKVMIPGFIMGGSVPRTVLIRAVGPTLAAPPFNVTGALADPVLRVFRQGEVEAIATNDDWDDDVSSAWSVSWISTQVGAFALAPGSHDAAVILTIEPNVPYSVVVSGKDGATGVALAEIYDANTEP